MRKKTSNLVLAGVGGVLIAALTHFLAADMDPVAQWDAFVRVHEELALGDAPIIAVALAAYVFVLLFGQIRINRGLIERTKADNRHRMAIENDLREALAARDGFFAAMSHDLKTPVNSIMGFSEMMRTQVFGALGNEKYVEYSEDINRAANMLDLTISQILDISRLNSDDPLAVREETFDLMGELDFCRKLICGWKGGRHTITVSGNIPPVNVLFDRTLFRRYVTNLLTNAVKYAGRDADIGIHVLCTGPGNNVYLTVYDNGVGLTTSRLTDASQRYARMTENSDSYGDSAGLGLWIVEKIAEAHDCEISIKSGTGHGFRVILGIPAERIVASDPEVFKIAC